jgi:hypothetical protein
MLMAKNFFGRQWQEWQKYETFHKTSQLKIT